MLGKKSFESGDLFLGSLVLCCAVLWGGGIVAPEQVSGMAGSSSMAESRLLVPAGGSNAEDHGIAGSDTAKNAVFSHSEKHLSYSSSVFAGAAVARVAQLWPKVGTHLSVWSNAWLRASAVIAAFSWSAYRMMSAHRARVSMVDVSGGGLLKKSEGKVQLSGSGGVSESAEQQRKAPQKLPLASEEPEEALESIEDALVQMRSAQDKVDAEVQRLALLYVELSADERTDRMESHMHPAALQDLRPLELLNDLYQHFQYAPGLLGDPYAPVSRGLRAQYIFLVRLMGLAPYNRVAVARKLKLQPSSVSRIYSNIKVFLQSYGASGVVVQGKEVGQKSAGSVEQIVEKLKEKVLAWEPSTLRSRLRKFVTAEDVLSMVEPHALISYMERNWPLRRIHVFLGVMLKLDELSSEKFVALHGREKKWLSQSIGLLRSKLARLQPKDLIVLPAHGEELVSLMRTSWQEVFWGGDHEAIRRQHSIAEESYDEFIASFEWMRQSYEEQEQLGKEMFLLRELLGWDQFKVDEFAKLLQISRAQATHVARSSQKKLTAMVDRLQRSFGSVGELYLHQRDQLRRLSQQELRWVPKDYRVRHTSSQRLEKSLRSFLSKHGLERDPVSISLFYAALGIPLVAEEELSSLFGLSVERVLEIQRSLHHAWLQDHLILGVQPQGYDALRASVASGSARWWAILQDQWQAHSMSPQKFRVRVLNFLHRLKGDRYRTYVFLALVLRLEQPSESLLLSVVRESPSLWQEEGQHFVSSLQLQSVKQVTKLIYLDFQEEVLQISAARQSTRISTQEELYQMLLQRYRSMSKEEIISFQEGRWQQYGDDVDVFARKLRSFLQDVFEKKPSHFYIFLAFNLNLSRINTHKYADLVGMAHATIYLTSKKLDLQFDEYLKQSMHEYSIHNLDYSLILNYFEENPVKLFDLSAELDIDIKNYKKIEKNFFECIQEAADSREDLAILAVKILKIIPLSASDMTSIFHISDNTLERKRSRIEEKLRLCLQQL